MGLPEGSRSGARSAATARYAAIQPPQAPQIRQPSPQHQPAEPKKTNVVIVVNDMGDRRAYWDTIEQAFPQVAVHPLLARGYGNFVENVIGERRIAVVLVLEAGGLHTILEATKDIRPQARPDVDYIVHDMEHNPLDEKDKATIVDLGLSAKMKSVRTREQIRQHLIRWMATILPRA